MKFKKVQKSFKKISFDFQKTYLQYQLTMNNNQQFVYMNKQQVNKVNFVYKNNQPGRNISPLKPGTKRESYQNMRNDTNRSPLPKQTIIVHNCSPLKPKIQKIQVPSVRKQTEINKPDIQIFSKYFPCAEITNSTIYQPKKQQKKYNTQKSNQNSQIFSNISPIIKKNQKEKEIVSPSKRKKNPKKNFEEELQKQKSHEKIEAREKQIMCVNNDNKKAKYMIEKQPLNSYCSKCSIVLVGKGFTMVEIISPKMQIEKKDRQLRQFLTKISTIREKLDYQLEKMKKQEDRIVKNSYQNKQIIQKKYNQIYKLLKDYELKDLSKIDQHIKQTLQKLQIYEIQFKQSIDKIILMKRDIIPNIEIIKSRIDETKYKQFMDDYQLQIKDIKQKLNLYIQNTFNFAQPQINIHKDLSKFSYEVVTFIKNPVEENKSSLFFSFEKNIHQKNQHELPSKNEQNQQTLSEGKFKEIISKNNTNQNQNQKPFRILFNQDDEKQTQNPSPNFKKF